MIEKIKKNPILVLIALAALAQGVMWVNLFSLIHNGILKYIGGLPAGLSIVGLVAYSANVLPRVQSKRARDTGWTILVIVMVCEPVVLGIVNWWVMPVNFKALSASYVVAGGASLVVSLSLVLGAVVDRSLVPTEKPAMLAKKPAKAKPEPVAVEPEPAKPALFCNVAGCERNQANPKAKPFGSQPALNAHQRKHKPVAYSVSLIEPVTKEQIK